jgi:DNA-binding MarR family transcriptional regulator
MALHNYLDEVLGSKAAIRVLRTLVRYKGKVFTVRELARTAGLSHPEVSLVVKDLESKGVVRLQPVGRAYKVSLNEESYLLKSIVEPMVRAEENTLDSLVSTLRSFFKDKGVTSVAIFGSVAKGLETKASDIDLLIIADERESANDCAARASTAIFAKFGLGLSPLIMNRTQFTREHGRNFAKSALGSYRLVWGMDLKELVEGVEVGR